MARSLPLARALHHSPLLGAHQPARCPAPVQMPPPGALSASPVMHASGMYSCCTCCKWQCRRTSWPGLALHIMKQSVSAACCSVHHGCSTCLRACCAHGSRTVLCSCGCHAATTLAFRRACFISSQPPGDVGRCPCTLMPLGPLFSLASTTTAACRRGALMCPLLLQLCIKQGCSTLQACDGISCFHVTARTPCSI